MTIFKQNLSRGSVGPDVMALQRFLEAHGYGDFVPTGFFGAKTAAAVTRFQADKGVDTAGGAYAGVFGPATRAAANRVTSDEARELLLGVAEELVGVDASPDDLAPDEYACAETACDVMRAAGVPIGVILSTYSLYRELLGRQDFARADSPLPGDVVISPTGYGDGRLPNGHVGFVAEGGAIISNSSADGTLRRNYTLDSWRARYAGLGGYPVWFFRRLS